jgi:Phospholipase_D-nuclease N-terminal/Short C-terminal domain
MTFGDFLLYMLAVTVWSALVVVLVFAVFDLFRRSDLSGWSKAIWLALILLVPLLGTFVYLVARPRVDYDVERAEAMAAERADRGTWHYTGGASSAEQLRVLADLADRGKISDEEYQAEKARILGGTRPEPAAPPPTAPAAPTPAA